MGAVAIFTAFVVCIGIGFLVIRKAKGRTSNPVYIPSLALTLLGGLCTFGARAGSEHFTPSPWLLVPMMGFLVGSIGIFSTTSPSWRGLVIDDIMRISGFCLLVRCIIVWSTNDGFNERVFVDSILWPLTACTCLVLFRFATARSTNFPDEARVMRIFAVMLVVMESAIYVATYLHSDSVFSVAQAFTLLTAAVLAYYLVLRVRTHDYRQYRTPPRPRPTFSQYVLVLIAAGLGLVSFVAQPDSRDIVTLVMAVVCVLATILRQAVTLVEYETLGHQTQQMEAHYRTLVQNSSDVIALADQETFELTYISQAGGDLLGVDVDRAEDINLADLLVVSPDVLVAGVSTIGGGKESYVVESKANGRVLETVLCIQNDQIRATIRDTSEREQLRSDLHDLAYIDQLTGVANRQHITDLVEKSLHRPSTQTHVLFIDLDRFKNVNDSGGHEVGDEVLRQVAKRLSIAIDERGMLGRVGGDEFLVLSTASAQQVRAVARAIYKTLHEPFDIRGKWYQLGGSIGIASGAKCLDAGEVIRRADIAMYAAKSQETRYVWFDASLQKGVAGVGGNSHNVSWAVENLSFEMYLQPQVSLATGQVIQTEALVRWRDQQGAVHTPLSLLSFAHQQGKIGIVTDWMLESAMQYLAEHPEAPAMSVNLPPYAVLDQALPSRLQRLSETYQVALQKIILELTEDDLLPMEPGTIRAANALRDIGVGLYSDDFGVGFSSLEYLLQLPLSGLKLNRAVHANAHESSGSRAFIAGMVQLGRDHSLQIIAHGVEQAHEHEQLCRLGVPFAQGFLYGKPAAADQIGGSSVLSSWSEHFGRGELPWGNTSNVVQVPGAKC